MNSIPITNVSIISKNNGISTAAKFFLIVILCLFINIPLYLYEDKSFAEWFTSVWVISTLVTIVYNRAFNLNITSYTFSGLLNTYFVPILTYIFLIGVSYWILRAQQSINDETSSNLPEDDNASRNFAIVIFACTSIMSIVMSVFYYKNLFSYYNLSPVWVIIGSICAFIFGSFCYYLQVLRLRCNVSSITDTVCWTYAAYATLLAFIITTIAFIILSFIPNENDNIIINVIKFFPTNFISNISAPFNIFTVIAYIMLWISSIIVFFRHKSTVGDEEGDPVNIIFTIMALTMLILLLTKTTQYGSTFITNIIRILMNSTLSSFLLNICILLSFILSFYLTITDLNKNGWSSNGNILASFILTIIFLLMYIAFIIRG